MSLWVAKQSGQDLLEAGARVAAECMRTAPLRHV